MGIWKNTKRGKKALPEINRKEEQKVEIPVKLVEPNYGRFVTLKISEENSFLKKIFMRQLIAYARALQNIYPEMKYKEKEDRVTLEAPDGEIAESFRSFWKNH